MKKKFLQELDNNLKILSRQERKKYLGDYEEMILDKIEDGMPEETAVAELGSPRIIAEEILQSYGETDNPVNKSFILMDICTSFIAYIASYLLWMKMNLNVTSLQLWPFAFVLPCYLVVYYFMGLYKVKFLRNVLIMNLRILIANIIGLVVLFLILYLFKQMDISRIQMMIFGGINLLMGMIVRHFWTKRTKRKY